MLPLSLERNIFEPGSDLDDVNFEQRRIFFENLKK